jgi:preprotein translocase subunit SecD
MTMQKKLRFSLAGIFLVAVASLLVALPHGPNFNLNPIGIKVDKELKIHEGLDLQGGSSLTYEADMANVPDAEKTQRLDGAKNVIESRVNSLGVSEPIVQTNRSGGSYRIVVELPGVTDVAEASRLIGQTVNLEFWETRGAEDPAPTDPLLLAQGLGEYKKTTLNGADLKNATVTFDQQTGETQIALVFNGDGTKEFAEISKRNLGKPVPITIDAGLPSGGIISSPTIQAEITDGNAIISGGFTVDQAKELALQLNSGALPVPVSLAEQRTVGPTLGEQSVQQSLAAGLIGLLLVAAFMIFYYRLPGVLAVVALLLYTSVMVALFKLIPVTLTLAGIAGFILSIGIAIDANILIFERMKEELRGGRSLTAAVERGFSRAFTSIRDSNTASLLMSAVLYLFGSGTIRGFAVVLALGVVVSLFSAITVTRTFMRVAARTRLGNKLTWWGLRKSEVDHVA